MSTTSQARLLEELQALDTNGGTVKDALLNAGYSVGQASRGIAGIPDKVMEQLGEKGAAIARLGRVNLQNVKDIAIGRLVSNCVEGTDKGAMSAKILGSHRELNLWTADNQTGVIVLNVPQNVTIMSDDDRQKMLSAPDE